MRASSYPGQGCNMLKIAHMARCVKAILRIQPCCAYPEPHSTSFAHLQETLHVNKVFPSLDAFKTAVWEECEEDGKTAKFLYPYYGKNRPAAFICGCELGRRPVSELGKTTMTPGKVENEAAGLSTSCHAEGADINMSFEISKEGNTTLKVGVAKGSCSIGANMARDTQSSESTSTPDARPTPAVAARGGMPLGHTEADGDLTEVRNCPRYIDYELRVQRREVCSFFVVSFPACVSSTSAPH